MRESKNWGDRDLGAPVLAQDGAPTNAAVIRLTDDFEFNPESVSISVGSSILWTNNGVDHYAWP